MYTNDSKPINDHLFTEKELDERAHHYIAVHEEAATYEVNVMRYGVLPGTVEDFVMRLSIEDQRHVEAIIEDAAAYLVRGEVARNYRGSASLSVVHAQKEKAINQLFESSLDDLMDVATKAQLAYLTSIIE
ncbi:hypothetical protein [Chromatium okenii]|jgi:Iap family predicted aminopeptidase|uniref:hypothetical protein n=1 Tax=Chromatium okenii TaxID=61644 RepID=UPI0026EFA85C|nr:hypothetical protein [Chromatium okenii]MBV5308378.1 hypothetical protein [Chromatium okenii]